jgi:hypothetical protein
MLPQSQCVQHIEIVPKLHEQSLAKWLGQATCQLIL